jgi:hypothetical protein
MSSVTLVHWFYFQENLIWWDGPFKKFEGIPYIKLQNDYLRNYYENARIGSVEIKIVETESTV